MPAKPPLHLLLHSYHTHTQSKWEVIRVSDRVQAKPFLFLPSSLSPSHCLRLSYTVTPRCSGPVTGAPEGPKACRTMTADCWQPVPKALAHSNTHRLAYTIWSSFPPLSSLSFFSVFVPVFHLCLSDSFSRSASSHSLCPRLKLLTQSIHPVLAVSGSPQLLSEPRARSLHWGAKRFWPPLKPWRFRRTQCCWADVLKACLEGWRPGGQMLELNQSWCSIL